MPRYLSTLSVWLFVLALAFVPIVGVVSAGEADVVKVAVKRGTDGSYRFDVTVAHDDGGWAHYANKWEVIGVDGAVLATRVLAHPHVHEQPFTRSLGGVTIPDGVTTVTVRAGDSVHGLGGKEIVVSLPE